MTGRAAPWHVAVIGREGVSGQGGREFIEGWHPLAKIDDLRALLEENGLNLTHSSHLADCIPILLNEIRGSLFLLHSIAQLV